MYKQAKAIANFIHKDDQKHLQHLIRVSTIVAEHTNNNWASSAALLQNSLEKSQLLKEYLRVNDGDGLTLLKQSFGPDIARVVNILGTPDPKSRIYRIKEDYLCWGPDSSIISLANDIDTLRYDPSPDIAYYQWVYEDLYIPVNLGLPQGWLQDLKLLINAHIYQALFDVNLSFTL